MSDDIRDEQLSRLYREAPAAEPRAALDAAILAAARAAVSAVPPRRRAWWQSWTLPMSIAASVVVTVTLTLMVQQEEERALTEAPAEQRAPAAVAPEKTDAADLAARPAPPPATPLKQAPSPTPAPREAARPPAVSAPVAVPKLAEESPAAPAAAAPGVAEKRQQAAPAADVVEMRARPAPLRKDAVGAAPARTPEQWLEEVRRLKQQGREREAAEALAEFRKAYPDYALPEDLR